MTAPIDPLLADAFDSGQLIRPSPQQPDLVHLVRAVATLAGVGGLDHLPVTRRLIDLIATADHLIFILVDGLGMNIVRRMSANSFVRSNLKLEMHAVCPSTTACALTSIATGEWPARHGVSGWFTHLPEFNLTATLLPFTERFTQQPLTQRGVTPEAVFPLAAMNPRMTHRSLTLLPATIVNSVYASYCRGATAAAGFGSFADGVNQIIAHVTSAREPTYTHLYLPDVDNVCHRRGVDDSQVMALADQIDAELARLGEALRGRARVIVAADHGLIDVPLDRHFPIHDGDEMLEHLRNPPSGDARMPLFHVRPERRGAFIEMFHRRFGEAFTLLPTDQVEQLRLFGPDDMSLTSRRRFGDFIGFARRTVTMLYHPPQPPPGTPRVPYLAQHAGLSRDEMLVPLVIS